MDKEASRLKLHADGVARRLRPMTGGIIWGRDPSGPAGEEIRSDRMCLRVLQIAPSIVSAPLRRKGITLCIEDDTGVPGEGASWA